jgi:hypothetical protein
MRNNTYSMNYQHCYSLSLASSLTMRYVYREEFKLTLNLVFSVKVVRATSRIEDRRPPVLSTVDHPSFHSCYS